MRVRTSVALVAALLLGGCLSSNVVLTVRPDGSGTIRQSLTLRPSAMPELDVLVPPDPGARRTHGVDAASESQQRLFDSLNFGDYVRLVSTVPDRAADRVGRTAVFEFDDISRVAVDLVPQTPVPIQGFLPSVGDRARTRLTFELSAIAGGNRRLTIRFPRFPLDRSAEPPGQWATGSVEEMAALKKVFADARIRLAVEPSTPILASNSPHRSDTEVVLFEMDAETALFSRQIDMLRATPASVDELLLMLGDLPGVTLAHDHVITIDFRGPDGQTPGAQPAPDTEIYLAPLSSADGKLTLGAPVNITNSPGYDNQPSFTPDGASLLFTSGRGAPPAAGATAASNLSATDIYRYDIGTARTVQVTRTPEGEYSPAVMPDGQRFSVVRVEAGGTQRLWSFALDGSDPKVVLADVKPVGYYAWVDAGTIALYILGQDGKPATLQVADVATGKATVVTERIGRSVQRMASGAISFVQQADPGSRGGAVVKQLFNARPVERASMGVGVLVAAVAESTDPQLAWMPDGMLLAAAGGTLYRWKTGEPAWTPVADLTALGLGNVSRLAVSPKGDRLALVNQAR